MKFNSYLHKRPKKEVTKGEFIDKNKLVFKRLAETNHQVKALLIHVVQNCSEQLNTYSEDLIPELRKAVEHLDRTTYIFNRMQSFK